VPSSRVDLEALSGAALLTHEALGALALDRDFRVLWANEAADRIAGRRLGPGPDGQTRSILDLLHPDDLSVAMSAMATADNRTASGERAASKNAVVVARVHDEKGWVHVEIHGVWTERGGQPVLVLVARDVSVRQLAVEALRMVASGAPLTEVMEQLRPAFAEQVGPVEITVLGSRGVRSVLYESAAAGTSGCGRPRSGPGGPGRPSVIPLSATAPGWWSYALPFGEADGGGFVVLEGCGLVPTPVWVQEVTKSLVDLISVSVAQSQALAELERRATTDPLTDLLNRTGLEVSLAASNGRPRALMCLDLDGFKEVNDLHGHLTGDALLIAVAERIRSCVRRDDVIGRFGGDEFIVLALDTDIEEIRGLADRLVHHLSEPFHVGGHTMLISASIGCAFASPSDDDATLIRRADDLLYQAKSLGGHRVEVDRPTAATEDCNGHVR
jgi:diguanylate cyclase (GGDEF)-like protein